MTKVSVLIPTLNAGAEFEELLEWWLAAMVENLKRDERVALRKRKLWLRYATGSLGSSNDLDSTQVISRSVSDLVRMDVK